MTMPQTLDRIHNSEFASLAKGRNYVQIPTCKKRLLDVKFLLDKM
jgi:hypothetical protein